MKLKQRIKHCGQFAIIATIACGIIYIAGQYFGLLNDVQAVISPLGYEKEVVVEEVIPELSVQEHVISIMKDEYGLDWTEIADALSIIRCESRWNPYAINKNKGGSYDLGLWQINEKYHEIERECAFDVFCSTRFAMDIYQSWGSWKAWICYR